MSAPQTRKPSGFARQTLLILLPLIGLAAFGLLSLQQDRRLARLAAVEQAQSIADFLLPRLWAVVQESAGQSTIAFSIDAFGDLAFPAHVPAPEDLAQLQGAPESSLSAVARYHEGLELLRDAKPREAASLFLEVSTSFPNARGETGLPIGPLAQFKLLQMQNEFSLRLHEIELDLNAFCSNLVTRPTVLTPLLLEKAGELTVNSQDKEVLRHWQAVWTDQEHSRELFGQARNHAGNLWNAPPLAPLNSGLLLVDIERQDTNRWFCVLTFADLVERIEEVVSDRSGMPPFLTAEISLAGVPLSSPGPGFRPPRGKHQATARHEVLASAAQNGGGAELLKVDVLLADPARLYRHQRTRTYWFAGFIGLSSAVALFGLFGAWRSFRQQERLNEMKSDFVSSVSHELRAPIASVRLMAENLESGKVAEEPRRMEYFRFISQECRRLSGLVENVLDFSSIEQNRKQYEFEPVDLRRIVDSTVRLLQPPATERGVTLSVADSVGTVPPISADGKALQQALLNLVDNAIKHSPRDAVVMVGLEIAPAGNGVRIWVEDNGKGIPLAEQEKIFERFYRLGSELRRETQGVGIGLSIVKHVVEAHHGRIHVRSAPGQGSRFTIELPGDRIEEKRDNEV
jgi:signal transduction histidine kinase